MTQSKAAQLQAAYARIPKIACKKLCSDSCGPIPYSREERRLIVKATGKAPSPSPDFTCSLLVDGLCTAYRFRPAICRLYGTVKSMACSHGCVPERWLSDAEAKSILDDVDRIGAKDSRSRDLVMMLAAAMKEAMRQRQDMA